MKAKIYGADAQGRVVLKKPQISFSYKRGTISLMKHDAKGFLLIQDQEKPKDWYIQIFNDTLPANAILFRDVKRLYKIAGAKSIVQEIFTSMGWDTHKSKICLLGSEPTPEGYLPIITLSAK